MSVFDQLTPQQKQIGGVGAVVVAVFALISRFKAKAAAPASTSEQSSTTDTTTGASSGLPTGSFAVGSTDAIGVGQLSDFESLLTGLVSNVSAQVDQLGQTIKSAPPPAAVTPPPPAATETGPAPRPVTTTIAQKAAAAVVGAAARCAGKPNVVPGYAPAPPGQWAEPIVVQGTTIGVAYHDC